MQREIKMIAFIVTNTNEKRSIPHARDTDCSVMENFFARRCMTVTLVPPLNAHASRFFS
jgi:hypothetical protein